MSPRPLALLNALVLLAALLAVTTGADAEPAAAPRAAAPAPSTSPSVAPIEPAPAVDPAVDPPAPPAAAPSTPEPPPAPRETTTTGYAPYATVGPVVLHAPGDVVEAIGFHQSGNDGGLPQSPAEGLTARHGLLEQRGRDTHRAGAADIVVDPAGEVRSPVTGTVLRAGSYTLYCDHTDDYVVVEPDARPGWEVKVLHFHGLQVAPGDRVEAGVTVIGRGGRALPFRSQVDDHTAAPAWPHLHLEVVDPSIPDRPSGGGC